MRVREEGGDVGSKEEKKDSWVKRENYTEQTHTCASVTS